MSDYRQEKVLRIPWSMLHVEGAPDFDDGCELLEFLEEKFPDSFGYHDVGKFQLSPTYDWFIDFVLDVKRNVDGDWGRVRELYPKEKAKYQPVFRKIDSNVNMDAVRLVEYCWYDGCEAPDYYDPMDDPFYDEV